MEQIILFLNRDTWIIVLQAFTLSADHLLSLLNYAIAFIEKKDHF